MASGMGQLAPPIVLALWICDNFDLGLVIKPGTKRNGTKRNETKRNGKDRQKCGLWCSEMRLQLEARRPDCRQTSDFSKTQSVDSTQC